ncbi:MAG: bifunctional diaminohydroxyphosphoribosylaminopyrimidine deaminase/5-amino-6-(5-phosphoribosylamino)uracil reductase RibD [Lachnospiraceae bacterium]|nr:bifunctional diaminohydroxyphosphoribosylaminopyrimidine deaminase/5-amino-6-(5-phosphoribosylamino)uracil reductase RibD [Lachnospiraceae bacterium]
MIEEYMRHAIELAKRGTGRVNPNPLVGAVIVKDGRILAEGYHACYGDLHAERHAFSKLTEDAAGAEMYVTLEPCCHHGKQPPCTEAIIEHGISKVYVGSDDPNTLVAGKGIAALRSAGIAVETHVLQEECDALNPVFFHFIRTQTPYVVMKYAMTMDGKIACETGASQWVTGEKARMHVQETRNWLAAIMVGVQTVLQDNPKLTCRLPEGSNPIRIVCDSHLRIPEDSDLVQTAKEIPLIVATLESSLNLPQADVLRDQGVDLLGTACLDGRIDLQDLMGQLGSRKIDSILLEGGGTLNESALRAGIVNRVQVYLAPKLFGGSGRYTPVRGEGVRDPGQAWMAEKPKIMTLGEDVLLEYDLI